MGLECQSPYLAPAASLALPCVACTRLCFGAPTCSSACVAMQPLRVPKASVESGKPELPDVFTNNTYLLQQARWAPVSQGLAKDASPGRLHDDSRRQASASTAECQDDAPFQSKT